jgi:hypothetical protein
MNQLIDGIKRVVGEMQKKPADRSPFFEKKNIFIYKMKI